ncbi:MAG: hypothetical protein J6S92_00305 [Oscillospiraceae bacterium]|nr:hypothetical protein [Bacteroidaceae bacterium]MBP0986717.1 hypothetical protein [Oscillospiraceae bacterium]
MGRKGRYESHVQPYLSQIQEWCQDLDEKQIAVDRLGIAVSTFEKYKREHKELQEALKKGKQQLIADLKASLKKKAKGFTYEETKTTIREEGNKRVQIVEKFKKYAPPDTGAIHLLLKNLDPEWTNDDKTTVDLKREQLELAKQKAENDNW